MQEIRRQIGQAHVASLGREEICLPFFLERLISLGDFPELHTVFANLDLKWHRSFLAAVAAIVHHNPRNTMCAAQIDGCVLAGAVQSVHS